MYAITIIAPNRVDKIDGFEAKIAAKIKIIVPSFLAVFFEDAFCPNKSARSDRREGLKTIKEKRKQFTNFRVCLNSTAGILEPHLTPKVKPKHGKAAAIFKSRI